MSNDLQNTQKRVLVISDNPELTSFFQNEWNNQNLEEIATVEYRYSSNNKNPEKMVMLGCSKINVKLMNFCQQAKDKYDLIISIHCKQIFPTQLVDSVVCVNLHPGFNPYNRGWYPQIFSIINKLPIGATLHIMDSEIDHGLIIAQKEVLIKNSDTSLDVYRRVISVEKDLIKENLVSLVKQSYTAIKSANDGNYNSIADFMELCKLDMNSIGSLQEHIDLLRSLTHGEHQNAYFIGNDNNKIYVSINLKVVE
jgi:methionyl-tRNA formyltransferase